RRLGGDQPDVHAAGGDGREPADAHRHHFLRQLQWRAGLNGLRRLPVEPDQPEVLGYPVRTAQLADAAAAAPARGLFGGDGGAARLQQLLPGHRPARGADAGVDRLAMDAQSPAPRCGAEHAVFRARLTAQPCTTCSSRRGSGTPMPASAKRSLSCSVNANVTGQKSPVATQTRSDRFTALSPSPVTNTTGSGSRSTRASSAISSRILRASRISAL